MITLVTVVLVALVVLVAFTKTTLVYNVLQLQERTGLPVCKEICYLQLQDWLVESAEH